MASFSRAVPLVLLVMALPLAGCDMLGGNDKGKDGEALGYACRVSNKLPEDCMKENNTYTPTSILNGWKTADKELKGGGAKPPPAEPAKEGEPKADGEQPPPDETKPAEAPPADGESQTTH